MKFRLENYSPLIGKEVTIINKESIYYHEWGTIQDYDGEFYYINIANGTDSVPVFDRKEFRLNKSNIK